MLISDLMQFGFANQSFLLWCIRHFCFVSLWNMQSILQVGCDSSICRQLQICDHASCKERRVDARDEDDVVRRRVDRRRISFRMPLEVLIGQLDRRLSSEVAKEKKVVKRQLKKNGEVQVRMCQRRMKMLSELQGCEVSLGRLTLLPYSMKKLEKFMCILDRLISSPYSIKNL